MKAIFAVLLLLPAVNAFAQADNTLQKYADKAVACVKQLGYANPTDNLSVIELDQTDLRIEIANHPAGTSGFIANMQIVNGDLYLFEPATQNLLYCK